MVWDSNSGGSEMHAQTHTYTHGSTLKTELSRVAIRDQRMNKISHWNTTIRIVVEITKNTPCVDKWRRTNDEMVIAILLPVRHRRHRSPEMMTISRFSVRSNRIECKNPLSSESFTQFNMYFYSCPPSKQTNERTNGRQLSMWGEKLGSEKRLKWGNYALSIHNLAIYCLDVLFPFYYSLGLYTYVMLCYF